MQPNTLMEEERETNKTRAKMRGKPKNRCIVRTINHLLDWMVTVDVNILCDQLLRRKISVKEQN